MQSHFIKSKKLEEKKQQHELSLARKKQSTLHNAKEQDIILRVSMSEIEHALLPGEEIHYDGKTFKFTLGQSNKG